MASTDSCHVGKCTAENSKQSSTCHALITYCGRVILTRTRRQLYWQVPVQRGSASVSSRECKSAFWRHLVRKAERDCSVAQIKSCRLADTTVPCTHARTHTRAQGNGAPRCRSLPFTPLPRYLVTSLGDAARNAAFTIRGKSLILKNIEPTVDLICQMVEPNCNIYCFYLLSFNISNETYIIIMGNTNY